MQSLRPYPMSCFSRCVRICKEGHISVVGKAASVNFSTSPDPSDVALSYTTYPDKEHTVDNRKTALIFAHGLFGAKGNLHSVSKHLSNEGRKVITYDARNHGDSDHSSDLNFTCMADDLDGLMQDLRLTQPFVMGHSMGGKTAMTLALNKPDSMRALIVADVTPGTSPGISTLYDYAIAMKNVKIPEGARLVQARRDVQAQLSTAISDRGILQFLLTNLRESENGQVKWRMNLDSFINNRDAIANFPASDEKPFDKPTLFVFGAKSAHYANSAGVAKIKDFFPKAEITAIPGAGHFVHAEKPLEFVNIVKQFCNDNDPAR